MSKFPAPLYRKTKGKRPKCQLYMPGFNPSNSCWLKGSWVTIPEEEWELRHKEHDALFQDVLRTVQNYRDPATPLDKLTEAQRIAYEYFSGVVTFDIRMPDGFISMAGMKMAGCRLFPGQDDLLRSRGARIIQNIIVNGVVKNVVEGFEIPEDLIFSNPEPMNPWVSVVDQNLRRELEAFEGMLEFAQQAGGLAHDFYLIHYLLERETSIIRTKWETQRGVEDPYADLERSMRDYVYARKKLKDAFPDTFEALYLEKKRSRNEIARHSLDHSEGVLYNYVLPTFHDDGSHEPWGPRDVPWGVQ